jgi:hypothetical protein
LSFAVAGRAELEAAVRAFEERGVEHSIITDLRPFGIAVLPFKDPDGIALEHRPALVDRPDHHIRRLVLSIHSVTGRAIGYRLVELSCRLPRPL